MTSTEKSKAWRQRNPERYTRYQKERYQRDKEKKKSAAREHYHQNRERVRIVRMLSRYGVTRDQFERILRSQKYCCAICMEPFRKPMSAHIDHCHNAGHVRGLLCALCNHAIGNLRNSSRIAVAAAVYLQKEELFNPSTFTQTQPGVVTNAQAA